ncbi:hypothetical protein MNV49_007046 [Pseudohyphozyma bogoriensis]|nr:hypothetical protein MNV49_007046 [Pseudohyphozyma bogoriensis]
MSNILSKIHPSAPYTPVIISFPISIRRFLDPAVSPIETDLALRINFGYLVFPNLPQSVDDVEKLKWSAVHGARLATRQFAKRFAPDATSRGQFHAHNHFHNMDRLHMRLGVEDYPIKEPKGAITCSMVGDLDRVLPTTFNVPTSSNTPSTIRLSDTMIGTRLHRGEGIFMEVFTWDQRITVCLGADDVCVEPALVQEILDQLETLAKCVATG